MSVAIIIPARYASTRLPGKPLADINGKPLIQWVYEACKKVKNADRVILATDNKRIEDLGLSLNATVFLTSVDHQSGTDRCAEVANQIDVDYVVNVQGDEPFIDPNKLEQVVKHLIENPAIEILTLFHAMTDRSEIADPSKVKLTKTKNNKILYFSRSAIPYDREKGASSYYKHVGIYAFKKETLSRLANLPPSNLEISEGLEQLRWLENGFSIHGLEIDDSPMGIDTPEDLEKARVFARNHY